MAKRAENDGSTKFSGRYGRRRLLEALKSQVLISGDGELARSLASVGELRAYSSRDVLIEQGSPDNDIFLIVAGEVSIEVNGRYVASRVAGTHIGEMALADALAKRSATVIAKEPTVTLRVPEHHFSRIAEKHPRLWRRIAVEIAKRLKERNQLLRKPHDKPVLFIGSSSESLAVANAVYGRLERKPLVPRLWSEGVFQASRTSIENLVTLAQEADFAALVLTSDDITVSRGKSKPSPRDNVIFELGLFMGTLGRERVFIIKPRGLDIRVPTDLLGVTWLDYARAGPRPLSSRLQDACARVFKIVRSIGPR
ncbi:MAG: nucleotide-binding protein [Acidobacteriia bacterium]|nr:nucleotide-binding protein [Terriglobia bacterium]